MTNKKPTAYRHGEIAFVQIDNLPKGLTKSTQKEFLRGSHGNPHTYDNGDLYLRNTGENVFGYFVAKNTKLYHPEHSPKGAALPNGTYELRRQTEFVNGELKQVID